VFRLWRSRSLRGSSCSPGTGRTNARASVDLFSVGGLDCTRSRVELENRSMVFVRKALKGGMRSGAGVVGDGLRQVPAAL
jgi:hypothetical protein